MKATITDTGGIRLLPECDADRFPLKRLADAGGIYVETVRYDSGPDQRMALIEFIINAKEARGGTAWKS